MSKYFFCYDQMLHKFLHRKHNQNYICAAIHETTNKKFWLYERNETVNNLISQYNEFMKQSNC